MPDVPDDLELYKPVEPERCDICSRADNNLLILDGWDPDEPGTAFLVCDTCMGWGRKTQLAAEYAAEDGL